MKKFLLLIFGFFFAVNLTAAFEMPFKVDELPDPETFSDPNFSGINDVGATKINAGILIVIDYAKKILGILTVLWIVYHGFSMATAGADGEQGKKARDAIIWGVVALCLMLIAQPMIVEVLYGGGEILPGDVLKNSQTIDLQIKKGTLQLFSFFEWTKALLVVAAMVFLIISGARMIFALGGEDVSAQKKTILWIAVGLFIVAFNNVLIDEILYKVIFDFDPAEISGREFAGEVKIETGVARGVAEIVAVVKFALKFSAVIAFAAFVAGGFLWIAQFGNESRVEAGRKIVISAGIGLFIILISFVLTETLISGQW